MKTATTFQIDTKLHHELKVALAKNQETMTEVLNVMIKEYIKKTK